MSNECQCCGGSGKIYRIYRVAAKVYRTGWQPCRVCGGEGIE